MSEDDRGLEHRLGNLLRAGVILAAAIVGAGGLALLVTRGSGPADFRTFRDAVSPLRSFSGIIGEALALRARGIIQAGLLVLVATPVMRVLFSLYGFARQRDWLYAGLTLVVLAALAVGLLGWKV